LWTNLLADQSHLAGHIEDKFMGIALQF